MMDSKMSDFTAESAYADESGAISPALRNYLRWRIYSINGYLKSLDARLIVALAAWQTANKIVGGLAEIGVHHGKLFFLLALSRQIGEKSLAIDLFEDDEMNASTRFGGRNRAFSTHAANLNVTLKSTEVLKADSLTLTSDDIMSRVGKVRIFSVDGGHLYHHVAHDLPLAFSILAPGGVIVMDDFCNSEWPEVTSATYDFVRAQEGKIVPAILTRNKLYLAPPDIASAYGEFATRFAASDKQMHRGLVEIMGRVVPYLTHSFKARFFDEVRSHFSTRF
jgi:methyltransferase family protein